MRKKLELKMQEHLVENMHSDMEKLLKSIFGDKGQDALINELDEKLIKKGKLAPKMLVIARDVLKIKRKVKNKILTQTELQQISRDGSELIAALVEYSQRKELVSVQKGVVMISYSGKKGELVLTDSGAFFITEGKIRKVANKSLVDSDKKEFEEALAKTKDRLQVKFGFDVLGVLKKEIGDFEIIL